MFSAELLADVLDDTTFPVLDTLIEYFAPEGPYLTFGSPGVARTLSSYGRTVLAIRPFAEGSLFDNPIPEVEVRIAGPNDHLVFPQGRFGFVHARWTSFDRAVLANLTRWLRPGGVLLVEAPDDYPAAALRRGPYRSVVQAAMERLDLPSALDLPARLMRHGLMHVGCRHEAPVGPGFHSLLKQVISQGSPWPEVATADLRDWLGDPVARTSPAVMNILAWGVKP